MSFIGVSISLLTFW